MKTSLKAILIAIFCFFSLPKHGISQQSDSSYRDIPFYEEARVIEIARMPNENWYRVGLDNTYKGIEMYLYIDSAELDSVAIDDTIRVETLVYTSTLDYLLVSRWKMIIHHDYDELPYTSEKEENFTEQEVPENTDDTKQKK